MWTQRPKFSNRPDDRALVCRTVRKLYRYRGEVALVLLASLVSLEATELDRKDINFAAEHVLESGMDARFSSLPLAFGRMHKGEFHPSLDLGFSISRAGLVEAAGPMLAAGLAYGLSDRWSLEGLAFYDGFTLSGGAGEDELLPLFHDAIPVALPQLAELSPLDGRIRQWGIGLATAKQWDRSSGRSGFWTLTTGALYSQLVAEDFDMRYRLTTGSEMGTEGILDLSATYSFLTPFADLRFDRPLGKSLGLRYWLTAGVPLPGQGFAGRITGQLPDESTFDLAGDTEQAIGRAHMGDPFLAFGLAIEHQRSRLSLDVGGLMFQTLYQPLTHEGIERAILIHLTWHGPRKTE